MAIVPTDKVLRERDEHDHYRTDLRLVAASLRLIPITPKRIYDPGAGTGVWGVGARKLWPKSFIIGIEPYFPNPKGKIYNTWLKDDYRKFCAFPGHYGRPDARPQLIMGNPPFSLAEEFIRGSLHMLDDGGYLAFLLRIAFLASGKRERGLWKECPPNFVYVLAQRPSFYDNGRTDDTDYAIYVWRKNDRPRHPQIAWLRWR